MKTVTVKIGGMSCQHCVKAVSQAVGQVEGVDSVQVDLAGETAVINYDETVFDLLKVREAVVEEGYDYQGVVE